MSVFMIINNNMIPSLKTALITGAASGIGKHYALALAKQGTKVAALDINIEALNALKEASPNLSIYPVDITQTAAVTHAVDKAADDLGSFDRVINAAAIMPCGSIMDHPTDNILKVMDINYGGLVNLTKAVMPQLLKQDKAEFVIFSSMLGIMPTLKTGAYSASKFATSVFAEVLAQEHKASNVQFACICPPAVNTPLLEQVRSTEWPKILDDTPPITVDEVVSAIEKGLKKKQFWIFPGRGTTIGAMMRRLFPAVVWKHIQSVEAK